MAIEHYNQASPLGWFWCSYHCPSISRCGCSPLATSDKDVDGFHPLNMGRLWLEIPHGAFNSGIMEMFKEYWDWDRKGSEQSWLSFNIVGKPMAQLLLAKNATNLPTHHSPKIARRADILVVAIGRAKFVTADFEKKAPLLLTSNESRARMAIVWDVDFDSVAPLASHITRYQEAKLWPSPCWWSRPTAAVRAL